MMTNGPQAASDRLALSDHADAREGVVASAMTWIQQKLCGLHGHDSLLQYQRNRIFLRCTSCGYETPGWDVSRTARPAPARGEAHGLPGTDLAAVRKIA